EILEYTVNGRVPRSGGNADTVMAPHGIYPCRATNGERWCAIVCEDDAQWHALVEAMGKPEWALDPRWRTAAGRKTHEAALDARLAEWTATESAGALAERLQAAGVAAGVAQSCADLHQDAGLTARRAFAWVEHPEMGRTPYETWAFRMGDDTAPRRAPLLGEHTHEGLTQVLRLSPDELARHVAAALFVGRASPPMILPPPRDPVSAVTHPDPYPYYAELVAARPFYKDELQGYWVASSAEAVTAALMSDRLRVRPPA